MNIQEDLDINDTVRVSSRCFEVSPFLERYESRDMVRGVYAGRFFTIHDGEDPIRKYWTLRRKALIPDSPASWATKSTATAKPPITSPCGTT